MATAVSAIPIRYDEALREWLDTIGLEHLRKGDTLYVQAGNEERHASCIRFAVFLDLRYDWHPDTCEFVIYPPE